MLRIFKKIIQKQHGEKRPECAAVVAAAGGSTRMEGKNKLFLEIGGMPVLARTLTALEKCARVREIVVVTREEDLTAVTELAIQYQISKAAKVVLGGATRTESVNIGLMHVSPDIPYIAVHDGARPFVTERILNEALDAAAAHKAAAPAIPVTSTVKQAKNGFVVKTVDRRDLFEIQTPQVFASDLIKAALQNAVDKQLYITDDCMAVEALGGAVRLTAGSRENIKLTTVSDMAVAEAILKTREAAV